MRPPGRRYPLAAVIIVTAALTLSCGDSDSTGEDAPQQPPVGEWLKGDLHLHSSHSTDALDNRVDEVIALAESRGMDYFVFTDHDNHVEGEITTWSDPLYTSESMVMLYGTEFTTARGHANLFSSAPWDHPSLYALRDGSPDELFAQAEALGLHFSINHPLNSDPWELPLTFEYDSIEVWNAIFEFPTDNRAAIEFWDSLLLDGLRIPARGGSDVHHQETFEAEALNVGNPTTWVLAEERTADAVIAGLEAGHASVSYDSQAERLEFTADTDGDGVFETMMGDNLPTTDEPVRFRVTIDGADERTDYTINVIRDGEPMLSETTRSSTFEFTDTPAAEGRTFYRIELNGPVPLAMVPYVYGDMIALSNPIYFGF